jgi:glutathione synthase
MPAALEIGVVMDPIHTIRPAKDSTFAMLLALARRGHRAHCIELGDLWLADGVAGARSRPVEVEDRLSEFHRLGDPVDGPMQRFDVVLMRKDPPFDMEYVYATYILEAAERAGVRVVNRPASLRDVNEKAFTAHFPQCCPPTLITRDRARIRRFLAEHRQIVVKPLDAMGGASVFRLDLGDPNTSVILETMTRFDHQTVVAQRFLPEYREGDLRILIVHGEAIGFGLARIPAEGESRANLAAGGRGEVVPLGERERWICAQVIPELRARGLDFVGLDVIGGFLTEINVTSPTGIREIEKATGLDIAGRFIAGLEPAASQ